MEFKAYHVGYVAYTINVGRFARDVISSRLITHPPSKISDLIECYNSTSTYLLDKHAPLISKIIRSKPSQPWFTPALNKLKSAERRLERVWSKSHSSDDLKLLRSAANHYHAAVIKAKRNFNLISSQVTNPRQLWKNVNKLLHRTLPQLLPSSESLS